MLRRAIAPLLALALLLCAPVRAFAQSEAGEIDLTVVDAATDKPLGNVRTFLLGAQTANALTTASGAIKFTDVPVGIYRIRLQLRGYEGAGTREFDVLPDRAVHVSIRLTPQATAAGGAGSAGGSTSSAGSASTGNSGLKTIGVVSAKAKISITTSDINADSPIRRLSDSLTDALDKLAGVAVTSDATDPNSPIQISLNNQDESQTALTLDGIPLSARARPATCAASAPICSPVRPSASRPPRAVSPAASIFRRCNRRRRCNCAPPRRPAPTIAAIIRSPRRDP
jgi:hypothetical protein